MRLRLSLSISMEGEQMTYKDLCAEILTLGFETESDSEERILTAVNRALMLIYTERPLEKRISFFKPKISPSSKIGDFSHKGGETDSFSYNARAYSFKTSGTGKYKICEGEKEEIFEFSQNSALHRGFLQFPLRLCRFQILLRHRL